MGCVTKHHYGVAHVWLMDGYSKCFQVQTKWIKSGIWHKRIIITNVSTFDDKWMIISTLCEWRKSIIRTLLRKGIRSFNTITVEERTHFPSSKLISTERRNGNWIFAWLWPLCLARICHFPFDVVHGKDIIYSTTQTTTLNLNQARLNLITLSVLWLLFLFLMHDQPTGLNPAPAEIIRFDTKLTCRSFSKLAKWS